ncbi:MAG: hypothetical protein PHS40_09865, partial [Mariniphaga sp.]|nr:hypothetical protein [Mariniphaga sp.]
MKNLIFSISGFFLLGFTMMLITNCNQTKKKEELNPIGNLKIGWASTDITPNQPVDLKGQFPARISEGILDPVTSTVLAIESKNNHSNEMAFLISCDLLSIDNELLHVVRKKINQSIPDIDPNKIFINATHTHTAPHCSPDSDTKGIYGIELDVMAPSDYLEFASNHIVNAVQEAWTNRKPGGISFGLGYAAVGQNRLQVDFSGKSQMYGNTNRKEFSHLEGYVDHSVNLLYTYDNDRNLTGIVINVACPSQATETDYRISADFWHDTRVEIKNRLGDQIFILPQCSAAGDQSPHITVGEKAVNRMQYLMGTDSSQIGLRKMGRRKQIALQIADAVTSVKPYMQNNIDWSPEIKFKSEVINLSRRLIDKNDVERAHNEVKEWEKKYNQLKGEITDNPKMKDNPRWYISITAAYRQLARRRSVQERFELEKIHPKMPIEINILRIGDMVMATNPFELYLDYGMRMKAQSPSIQTFIIQLAGPGTYLPTERATEGGAYGSVPASTYI